MATEEANVTIFTCDSPKCTTRIVREAGEEELPEGYHGKVLWIHSMGGSDAEWFACRPAHIRDAVEAALAKANRQPE